MKALITGGCGFIGSNAARLLHSRGYGVTVLDNLSRPGAEDNLDWLRRSMDVDFIKADVRQPEVMCDVVQAGRFDLIIHLAAQVAVTTSVIDPRHDFETNALGTLNVLEAVRLHSRETIVLNASTNKVYGGLPDLTLREEESRYVMLEGCGVAEDRRLDFHSPYGCSKGAADQYVADYARIYGLKTVNFRQSCIYGPRQFGMEDQGWVAWFTIAHQLGHPITVYGNGKQVRDLLYVDDLVECYLRAVDNIGKASGKSFNVGGGPANVLSILELFRWIEEFSGRAVEYSRADWRPGDQLLFVSDIRRAESGLGWRPGTAVHAGVRQLYDWVAANLDLFRLDRDLSRSAVS